MHITRGTQNTSRLGAWSASATVVALLTIASCGGRSAAAPPLSKADYIKAGNAVCASADAKINTLTEPTNTDPNAWKSYLDELIPIVKSEVAHLKALTPPRSDQPTIDSLLALVNTATEDTQRARSAAAAGNSDAIGTALQAVSSSSDEADKISNSYGLDVCGQP